MTGTTAADGPPPWVWDQLPDAEQRQRWRGLDEWVDWLQEAYAPWVRLPPCWPGHEGLRMELTLFWYWQAWLMNYETDPVAGVRWHTDLRRAAAAWRKVAGCDHRRHWNIDMQAPGSSDPVTPWVLGDGS